MRKALFASAALATLALAYPAAAENRLYALGDKIGQRLLSDPDITVLYVGYDREGDTVTFSMKPKVCALDLPPDNLSFTLEVGQKKTFLVKTECNDGCRSYALSLQFKHWSTLRKVESEIMMEESITLVSAPTN